MSEGASNPAKKPKKPVRLSLSSRLNLWFYRALFGALWALRPPRPRSIRLSGQSRVLAFSSAGLGDALLDSVAFRALAETYPGIHLAAVVHHRRPQIAQHNPLLKKLYFLRKGPLADLDLHRVIELPRPPGYKTPADAPMSLIQPEQVLPEVMTVLTRS